jgi:diacylglycerol kinase
MVGSMLGSVGYSIHHVDRLAQKDVAVRVKRHAVLACPTCAATFVTGSPPATWTLM